jgi:trans-aconitate methyltransferase
MTTAYDTVVYPSMVFEQTHPERLRVIAHIHGLSAPPVETARVLEIGGGDGLNLIAFAAAYPKAQCEGFDLAATAVERGNTLIDDAGLSNVRLNVRDIMDARAAYAVESFDYVIAHGVYAWVPEPVRAEMMALIGHVLAPDGVAFVSYNAMPGGYVRMMMRDMLLHALDGREAYEDKISIVHQCLELFAKPQADDEEVVQALRKEASSMLERPDSVLFHDELGGVFVPQRLTDVAAAAAANGLLFLSDDPRRDRHLDGFLPDAIEPSGDVDALVVRAAQATDYAVVRFFRQSLFVKAGRKPLRKIDLDQLDGVSVSGRLTRDADGRFRGDRSTFKLDDESLIRLLDIVSDNYPERFPFAEKVIDPIRRRAMLDLFAYNYIRFHLEPEPMSLTLPERPEVSPLARAQLRANASPVLTLTHRMIEIEQPNLKALLIAADGSRTVAEIAALPDLDFPASDVAPALAAAARLGLIVRPR